MYLDEWVENTGFGKVIESPTEVKGGLLHKMYAVTTDTGKYAVKVLNGEIMKKSHALQNTINSEKIAYIMSKDIPIVSSIIVAEKQIHMSDGYYLMIFPWLEGRSVYAPEISVEHCRIIGDALGRIHKLDVHLDGIEIDEDDSSLYDWEYLLELASEKISGKEEWYCSFKTSIDEIVRWESEANDAQEYLKRNRVISHRDLDPKNVMWDGMQAYIIDWEAAGYINPYQELLEVINYWATDEKGQLKKEFFDAIIEAYKVHINIDDVEWEHVFAGSFTGMLGWLEYNVKRAVGLSISDSNEIKIGAKQVVGTIKELFSYQSKTKLIKEWLRYDR